MDHINGEHYRGSIGDLRAFQRPGLETFRRYIRGELPAPPISRLVGMRPTEAGLGKATFTMPVTHWLEEGFGLYWGGVYALFADAPLASAIWTTLPEKKTVATSERFTRPALVNTGPLTLSARVNHRGRLLRVTSCNIDNAEGKRVAMATSSALVVEGGVRELTKGRLPEEILGGIERADDRPA